MFITKKHLSRRTMLRGMGATLALPFLESMVPAQTPLEKTAAKPKSRLACIEIVHGAAGSTTEGGMKNYWSPEKTGSDFEMGESLKPLNPLRVRISNLQPQSTSYMRSVSVRIPRFLRCSLPSKVRTVPAHATMATLASTPIPYRGLVQRLRCR